MATYYPAPTAAYSEVKFGTNVVAAAPATSDTTYCTGNPTNPLFLDSSTQTIFTCASGGTTCPGGVNNCEYAYSTPAPKSGTVLVDSMGTIHVMMVNSGGVLQDVIYPQQCYNSFCSYNPVSDPTGSITCPSYVGGTGVGTQGPCKNGFTQSTVDSNHDAYNQYQTSATSAVVSLVCCSGIIN